VLHVIWITRNATELEDRIGLGRVVYDGWAVIRSESRFDLMCSLTRSVEAIWRSPLLDKAEASEDNCDVTNNDWQYANGGNPSRSPWYKHNERNVRDHDAEHCRPEPNALPKFPAHLHCNQNRHCGKPSRTPVPWPSEGIEQEEKRRCQNHYCDGPEEGTYPFLGLSFFFF
jgi:hypothetical protein